MNGRDLARDIEECMKAADLSQEKAAKIAGKSGKWMSNTLARLREGKEVTDETVDELRRVVPGLAARMDGADEGPIVSLLRRGLREVEEQIAGLPLREATLNDELSRIAGERARLETRRGDLAVRIDEELARKGGGK